MLNSEPVWFVYLLMCSDATLYCGITTDINRRVREHNLTKKGAKYTRSRRPVKLIGFEKFKNRSEATKEEIKIKKLSRSKKLSRFSKDNI
jgi:putative endonuclease